MKLIHLSDLHLGKRVNNFSMIEDQQYILHRIINIIDAEKPQAVLLAGDVYDRSIPSEESVELFDEFLFSLAQRKLDVFVISGNHDSEERVAFGGRVMEGAGIHLAPVYAGNISTLSLNDEYGRVNISLIPFLKPANVRRFYPDEEIVTYTDAMRVIVNSIALNPGERNIALVHQFITGAVSCDSEELSVGGTDAIDSSVFDGFDYVALGHLHGPQHISREGIRYCGSPLKYSFSECTHEKSVTVVELAQKGKMSIRTVPLIPLHDMRRISGSFEEISTGEKTEDYLEITLTDELDVPNAFDRLRKRYPGLMVLRYNNTRTRANSVISGADSTREKAPLELFEELYSKINGKQLDEMQREYLLSLAADIWEDEI